MRKIIRLLSVVLLILAMLTGCSGSKYKEATELFNAGNYAEARAIFVELGDYEDSEVKVKECDYQMAEELLENRKFEEARELYLSLEDFQDCEEKAKECLYQLAMSKIYINDKSVPIEMLAQIPGYKDADAYIECYNALQTLAGTYACHPEQIAAEYFDNSYEYKIEEMEFRIADTFRKMEKVGVNEYRMTFDVLVDKYALNADGITHSFNGTGIGEAGVWTFEGHIDYALGEDDFDAVLVFTDDNHATVMSSKVSGVIYGFCFDEVGSPALMFAPYDQYGNVMSNEYRPYLCYRIK